MKIHTLTVIDNATGQVDLDEFYDYDGPVALAGSSPSGNTTTVQKSDPWSGQQPYLTDIFNKAQQWNNSGGAQYYPGQQIANQSNPTSAYINDATTLGSQGTASGNAAQNQATNIINGANLYGNPTDSNLNAIAGGALMGSNPYLSGEYDNAAQSVVRNYQNAVAPGIDSQMEAAGRYGSGAQANQQSQAQQNLGQSLGNMASSMYGGAYQSDMSNMMQANAELSNNYNTASAQQLSALGMSPSLNAMDWQNLSGLQNAGSQQDQYNQSLIGANQNEWAYNQNLPLQTLGQYMQMVQGNYGGTSSTTSPYFSNPMGNLLGTGALANSMFGSGGMFNGLLGSSAAASSAIPAGTMSLAPWAMGAGGGGMAGLGAMGAGDIAASGGLADFIGGLSSAGAAMGPLLAV